MTALWVIFGGSFAGALVAGLVWGLQERGIRRGRSGSEHWRASVLTWLFIFVGCVSGIWLAAVMDSPLRWVIAVVASLPLLLILLVIVGFISYGVTVSRARRGPRS